MLTYAARRLVDVIPVLLVITLLAFLVFYLDPSDPVVMIAGEHATPEIEARIRSNLGLDQPAFVQYVTFLGNTLTGDFGTSYRSRQPVIDHIAPAFLATLYFTGAALVLVVLIGIPAGVLSAARPNGWVDRIVMSTVLVGLSAPIFWVGIVLMYVFAFRLGWFPTGGFFHWSGIVLPSVTLALQYGAIVARVTRTSMLEVLGNDYIRTARAKGAAPSKIYLAHALRNASLPIVTTVGLQVGSMLGGTILIETVFAWPGLGRMLVNAILERDAPIVQAGVMLIAIAVLVLNLLTDVVYGFLDPRVRFS